MGNDLLWNAIGDKKKADRISFHYYIRPFPAAKRCPSKAEWTWGVMEGPGEPG